MNSRCSYILDNDRLCKNYKFKKDNDFCYNHSNYNEYRFLMLFSLLLFLVYLFLYLLIFF